MAGEDLFEQGGACTRQAEDEDRIGRGMPLSDLLVEQRGRADLLLPRHFRAHAIGAVLRLRTFERIALAIMREAFLVFFAILQRLAECEGKMHPVHEGEARSGKPIAHRDEFFVCEAVGFEIGEGIPRIAMCRCGGNRLAIARDRILLPPHRLQRMALAGQGCRVIGQRLQDAVEEAERAFVVAGLHRLDGETGLKQRAIRIAVVKCFGLIASRLELLAAAQRIDIVEADLDIVGRKAFCAVQQEFGIIQNAEPNADLGEQTHCFHIAGSLS